MSDGVKALDVREPSARYVVQDREPLVRAFDALATAPSGVNRLRSFIRSLSVRGFLVPQDATEEAASSLKQRIDQERATMFAGGLAKREKPLSPVGLDERDFSLPASWQWVRFDELVRADKPVAYGVLVPGPDTPNGVPFVRLADLSVGNPAEKPEKSISATVDAQFLRTRLEGGEILLGVVGSIGKVGVAPDSWRGANIARAICRIMPTSLVDWRYVLNLLQSEFMKARFVGDTRTLAQPTLNVGLIRECPVPLPPLAEQHRIVARVEELMKLCDALEQSGRLADEQHARLTSTLFDALAASESAHALAENWQRVAEHFDILLDRLEAINAFEQIGIQLAVRGLLVPQDDGDGSGHDLRKRHLQAVPAGGQRGRTELAPRSDDDAPFLAPDSWAWASFGEVADVSGGVTLGRKGALALPVTLPYLRVANVQRGRLNLTAEVKTVAIDAAELQRFQLKLGDLLITEGGDWDKVGRTCIWRGEIASCLHQNHIFRARGRTSEWLPEWGELYLNSADARSYFAASAKQTTNLASINMTQLRNCAFPLPPIAEQHRIVARVEELRRLCADLRQRLTKARETQSRLADALVAEVA